MDASLLRPTERERARTAPAPVAARTSPARPNGWLIAAAVLAVAVGIALRFFTSSHLWLDEALTVNIAKLPLDKIPDALRRDGSPPLYYAVLHFWMDLFGSGDLAVRALSGVFAVAALPLAWVAGRKLGGRPAAVAALLLVVSSPFAIRYATEARMYSLLTLLALAGYLVLRRLLERPTALAAVGLAVLTGALLLTHYWSLYLIGFVGLLLAIRYVRRRDRASLYGVLALIAGGLFLVPWLPVFTYQAAHTGTPWAGRPSFGVVIDTVRAWSGGATDAGQVLNLVVLVLAGLAVFGVAIDRRRIELDLRTTPGARALALASIGTLQLGLVAGAVISSAYVIRYTAVAFPLFMLVAAFGTLVFADSRVRLGVVTGAVILGFIAVLPNTGGLRTEARVVANALNRTAQPGDVVVYCPDQLGPAMSRELKAPVTQLTFPSATGPEFVDWVDYQARNEASRTLPFAEMVDQRAANHRVWLVWSPGYRTYGTKCSVLQDRLKTLRGNMTRVLKVKPKYEERMGLLRFDPR